MLLCVSRFKKAEGKAAYPGAEDPGVLSVTRIFHYYKKHGYVGTRLAFRVMARAREASGIFPRCCIHILYCSRLGPGERMHAVYSMWLEVDGLIGVFPVQISAAGPACTRVCGMAGTRPSSWVHPSVTWMRSCTWLAATGSPSPRPCWTSWLGRRTCFAGSSGRVWP